MKRKNCKANECVVREMMVGINKYGRARPKDCLSNVSDGIKLSFMCLQSYRLILIISLVFLSFLLFRAFFSASEIFDYICLTFLFNATPVIFVSPIGIHLNS